jgi:putative endonuclease
VDRRKQDRLRMTASMYLAQNPTKLQPRFDVIEIYAPEGENTEKPVIEHLEDAFQ